MPFRLLKGKEYTICRFSVEDGDTVKVHVEGDYSDNRMHRIRLHGIDAPELGQPMGYKSRSKLETLCDKAESLTVFIKEEEDRYGRPVGILYGHHQSWTNKMDINRTMVVDGFAYAYAYNGEDPYRGEDNKVARGSKISRQQLKEDLHPSDYRRNQKSKPKEPYYKRFLCGRKRSA